MISHLFILSFLSSLASIQQYKVSPQNIQKLSNYTAPINVHIIAHTHNDPGWLKTVDEYYSGTNNSIVNIGVTYILDSVVFQLLKDPSKRFTYVQMSFFSRWWTQQSDQMKEDVRYLVKNKQLEFVNGGWVMNDEAACHYEDIIEQMTLGHQFLLKEFGVKPTIGWHIDPFGHSSAQPYLFSAMGFEAWFFARMGYQDQEHRKQTQSLQFIWTPLSSQGERPSMVDDKFQYTLKPNQTSIFTHMMYGPLYCIPQGLTWDQLGSGDQIVDDPLLEGDNVEEIVNSFIKDVLQERQAFRHNQILFPMGCDFHFQNAHLNYANIDKLIKYVNAMTNGQVTARYSTPGEYIKSIKVLEDITWPTNYWDFFTYNQSENSYWSGYFTSRPTVKGYVRDMSNLLRASQLEVALSAIISDDNIGDNVVSNSIDGIQSMRKAISLSQHHDAVTGTEKQHVANDYVLRLAKAEEQIKLVMSQSVKRRIEVVKNVKIDGDLVMCKRLNTTYHDCPTIDLVSKNQLGESKELLLVVQNPGKQLSNQLIKVRIPNGIQVEVQNEHKKVIESEIICHFNSIDQCVLYFEHSLPEVSLTLFKLKQKNSSPQMVFGNMYDKWGNITAKSFDQNVKYTLFHDHQNNTFVYQQQMLKPSKLREIKLNLTHRYYNSYQGKGQTSGAYIFRPDPSDADSELLNNKTPKDYETYAYKGKIAQQFWHEHQHTRMLIRLNKRGEIQVETFMREIPLSQQGKQVTFNVETEFDNNQIFYTDSTGMAMQKRELNKRPQIFNYTTVQPISSNYFPLTSAIMFQENNLNRVSVFTDRSEGGGVIKPGRIEVMVNRRLYKDDYKGVNEPLNQTNADGTKGLEFWVKHTVQIKDLQDDHQQYMSSSEARINQPINLLFGKISSSDSNINDNKNIFNLNKNIKLNLYPVEKGKIRVRLQNIKDAVNHDVKTIIKVDVQKLALDLYVLMNGQEAGSAPKIKIVALNLSGNQLYEQAKMSRNMYWRTQDGDIQYQYDSAMQENYEKIEVSAQEHRLFQFEYGNDQFEIIQ